MLSSMEALKAVATKAPFGQGSDTLHDDSVRNAWQIDAAKVKLGGEKVWDDYMTGILKQVCRNLGLSNDRFANLQVRAELYKLLLYETGGHFKTHRDTEKEEGMFATLIVQLPSKFEGGAFTVSHQGETKTFELSANCASQFKYIAICADCEHQLHAVTSGVRLCLAFNLVAERSNEIPTHSVNTDTETKLRSMVDKWNADDGACEKLGFRMAHQYTPQSFGIGNLKGRDSNILQTLLSSKSLAGGTLFNVHLLLMERCIRRYGGDWLDDKLRVRMVLNRNGDEMLDRPDWAMFQHHSDRRWMLGEHDYEAIYGHLEPDYDRYLEDLMEKYTMFLEDPDEWEEQASWYYAAAFVIAPNAKT